MDVHEDGPDVVLCDLKDGVATLRLNRPHRRNAWTAEMERRLLDLLDECDGNADVRIMVLTGAGGSFCPGMDMQWLQQSSRSATPADSSWRTRPMTHVRSIRKPTIAAINGGCAGIGLVQALSCDIRFAAAEARISPVFTRRGLPAAFGVSWLLTGLIGAARAAELLISSRTITGAEALGLGLLHRLCPVDQLMQEVQEYAAELAAHWSPRAMAAVKEQLAADWSRTLAEADADARQRVADPDLRRDYREGVAAYVDKRSPAFRSLNADG